MSADKKQKILRESLEAMGVSEDVLEDLQKYLKALLTNTYKPCQNSLIRVLIVEKKRSKEVVLKELNELGQIVPEVSLLLFSLSISAYSSAFQTCQTGSILKINPLTFGTLIECQYGRIC